MQGACNRQLILEDGRQEKFEKLYSDSGRPRAVRNRNSKASGRRQVEILRARELTAKSLRTDRRLSCFVLTDIEGVAEGNTAPGRNFRPGVSFSFASNELGAAFPISRKTPNQASSEIFLTSITLLTRYICLRIM
jgi:hypothetical protein